MKIVPSSFGFANVLVIESWFKPSMLSAKFAFPDVDLEASNAITEKICPVSVNITSCEVPAISSNEADVVLALVDLAVEESISKPSSDPNSIPNKIDGSVVNVPDAVA